MKRIVYLLISCIVLPSVSVAEDLNEIFKKMNQYLNEQNYPKALEELAWAKKEIEKLNSNKLGTLLPKEINGFVGDEPKVQSALGFNTIERNYSSGGKQIKLSLTGGGGAGSAMSGLAGLAQMGMMLGGGQAGMDTFRIDGRTATLDSTSGSPELTIMMESGSILKLDSSGGVDAGTLKSFAEGLKVSALDSYLKGAK